MKNKSKKGFYSQEGLKGFVKSLILRKEISKCVKKEFDTIKDLIIGSSKNNDFLTVANDKCLFTFEMALKKRFEEIEGKKTKKALAKLITWADKNQLLEDDANQVRKVIPVRDSAAHPDQWISLGAFSLYVIQHIKNMINGFYEDTKLRKERKLEYVRFEKLFNKFNTEGSVLEMKNSKLIIFHSQLLGIENRITPPIYYFLFLPIFDLTIKKDKSVNNPRPIISKTEKHSIMLNRLLFHQVSNKKEVVLTIISESKSRKNFMEWKRKFTNHKFPLGDQMHYKVGIIKNSIRDEIFSKFY